MLLCLLFCNFFCVRCQQISDVCSFICFSVRFVWSDVIKSLMFVCLSVCLSVLCLCQMSTNPWCLIVFLFVCYCYVYVRHQQIYYVCLFVCLSVSFTFYLDFNKSLMFFHLSVFLSVGKNKFNLRPPDPPHPCSDNVWSFGLIFDWCLPSAIFSSNSGGALL